MKRVFLFLVLALCMPLGLCAQTGRWSGKLALPGQSLTIVFNFSDNGCTLDVPDQGAKGIEAQVSHQSNGSLRISVPSIGASFEGYYLLKTITGTFSQSGLSFPLTLTPGAPELNRPQTPAGPFPYGSEEVSFTSPGAVLSGTLVLPEGYDENTPVFLMLTGSGLQNRDEEIYEHKPFAVIADAFARNGIATLRFDDRGFGKSTGTNADPSIDDFTADALAGVAFLRERFSKVGVLGHSEGGSIALALAADGKADFVISLAGMVLSGSETLVRQNRHTLEKLGFDEAVVGEYCSLISAAFASVGNGTPVPSAEGRNLPAALVQNYSMVLAQLSTSYVRSLVTLDVGKSLPKVNCPVLALNGTLDSQVEAEANLQVLREKLPQGKGTVLTVEGVNHLFQHCTTGETDEYRNIEETIAPEALALMTEWISKTVK